MLCVHLANGQRGAVASLTPEIPQSALQAALWAGLGSFAASGVALLGLVVGGPVSPGVVAGFAHLLIATVFPTIPLVLLGWTAARLFGMGRRQLALVGGAMTVLLLPGQWIAWTVAAVAVVGAVLVPERFRLRFAIALGVTYALVEVGTGLIPNSESPDSPSVVLVTLAGVGAQPASDWPSLSALAQDGVSFRQANVPIDTDTGTLTALFSGQPHWEVPNAQAARLMVTLAEQGFETASFAPASYLQGADTGRVDGENTWLVGATHMPVGRLSPGKYAPRGAAGTVDRVLWWAGRQHRPYAAWVHLADLYGPLDPPPPFDQRFISDDQTPVVDCVLSVPLPTIQSDVDRRYLGTLASLDYELGRLTSGLRDMGQDPIIVVVGTHGLDMTTGCAEPTADPLAWHVPFVVAGANVPQGIVVDGPIEVLAIHAWLTGEGDAVESSWRQGQSVQSAARSTAHLPSGWVASVANRHGRSTLGAEESWTVQSEDMPEDALRSLLEARAMRILYRLDDSTRPDIDPSSPAE